MIKVKMLVALAVIFITFQNCSKMDFETQVVSEKLDQASQGVEEVTAENPPADVNKARIFGTVKDVWGKSNSWLATGPIKNVKIILKKGIYSNPNTRKSASIAEIVTDESGKFDFQNLDVDNYTIYWTVPSSKYYFEPDYRAAISPQVLQAANYNYDVSDSIWIHKKGISYHCVYEDYAHMSNLIWKYYRTTSAYSSAKVDLTAALSGRTDGKGYLHIDTTLLPESANNGGMVELEDSSGQVVGRAKYAEFKHLALTGGGRCANGL